FVASAVVVSVTGAVVRELWTIRWAIARRTRPGSSPTPRRSSRGPTEYPTTSCSRIRPFRPVPLTWLQSMPNLAAALRARGVTGRRDRAPGGAGPGAACADRSDGGLSGTGAGATEGVGARISPTAVK